jgi:hypothetical protein
MLSQFLSLYLMSQQPQPQQKDGLVFAGFISLVGGLFLWEKNRVGKSKEEVVIPPQPSSKTNSSVKTEATVQPTAEIDTPSIPTHSFKFSDDISELLSRIAREDGSTALCGDPGTGKSTITREYIRQVQESSDKAVIKVLAVKNDSFCGLRESGNVTQFDEDEIDVALSFFKQVKDEYKRRKKLPEGKRGSLPPYVVILDDWISISSALIKHQSKQSRRSNKPDKDDFFFIQEDIDFGSILYNILTIGREFNMKFFVNLHSLNLEAIGIKSMDSNSRSMLKVILLGNRYIKAGRQLDAYGIIERAITGTQVIVDLEIKKDIREQYYTKKEESRNNCQPICFAFIGEYYVGLVPRFGEVVQKTDNLESSDSKGSADLELEEPIEPLEPQESSDNLEPTLEERFGVIRRRKQGLPKKDIIYQVWGATKGGGKSYKLAEEKYKKIID